MPVNHSFMADFIHHDSYVNPAIERIPSYFCKLFLLIRQQSLQYCILETETNECIALADFRLNHIPKTPEIFLEGLDKLVAKESALHQKYASVVVGLETHLHTLVPDVFFNAENPQDYLEFNLRMPDNHKTSFDQVHELNSVCIYAYPQGFKEFLSKNFPSAALLNPLSGMLQAVYRLHNSSDRPESFFLHASDRMISMFFTRNGSMPVYYNSFPYTSREDILYYALYAYEQLGIKPESVPLTTLGELDQASEINGLLQQYFPSVSSPGDLSFALPRNFHQQVRIYRYIQLFSLALCV